MGRYAFKNEHEFLTVGMTNDGFRSDLAKIRIGPELAKTLGLPKQAMVTGNISNGFKAFVNAIRRVLGLASDHLLFGRLERRMRRVWGHDRR
jgi:hypothetical protein